MPEAEIKINFAEVTKAQAQVKQLREELNKLSSTKGQAGGTANSGPVAQVGQNIKDIGKSGPDALGRVNREIVKMTDLSRIAAVQAKHLMHSFLGVVGPSALVLGAYSMLSERRSQESSAARSAGAATGAAVAQSKMTPAQVKALQEKYRGFVSPKDVADIAANTPGSPARVERAIAGKFMGMEGVPSEKKLQAAETKQRELFESDPSFRRSRQAQREAAAEEKAKEVGAARRTNTLQFGYSLEQERREREAKQLQKDVAAGAGTFEPLPVRVATPSNGQSRP